MAWFIKKSVTFTKATYSVTYENAETKEAVTEDNETITLKGEIQGLKLKKAIMKEYDVDVLVVVKNAEILKKTIAFDFETFVAYGTEIDGDGNIVSSDDEIEEETVNEE